MIDLNKNIEWISLEKAYGLDFRMVRVVEERDGEDIATDYIGLRGLDNIGNQLIEEEVIQRWLKKNNFNQNDEWYLANPSMVDQREMLMFFDQHEPVTISERELFVEKSERVTALAAVLAKLRAEEDFIERDQQATQVRAAEEIERQREVEQEAVVETKEVPTIITLESTEKDIEQVVNNTELEGLSDQVRNLVREIFSQTGTGEEGNFARTLNYIKTAIIAKNGTELVTALDNQIENSARLLQLRNVISEVNDDMSDKQVAARQQLLKLYNACCESHRLEYNLPAYKLQRILNYELRAELALRIGDFDDEAKSVIQRFRDYTVSYPIGTDESYRDHLKNRIIVPGVDTVSVMHRLLGEHEKYQIGDQTEASKALFEALSDFDHTYPEDSPARSLLVAQLLSSDFQGSYSNVGSAEDYPDLKNLYLDSKRVLNRLSEDSGATDWEGAKAAFLTSIEGPLDKATEQNLEASDYFHRLDLSALYDSLHLVKFSVADAEQEEVQRWLNILSGPDQDLEETVVVDIEAEAVSENVEQAKDDYIELASLPDIVQEEVPATVEAEPARETIVSDEQRAQAILNMDKAQLQELLDQSYNMMLEAFSNQDVPQDLARRANDLQNAAHLAARASMGQATGTQDLQVVGGIDQAKQLRLIEIVYNLHGVIEHVNARRILEVSVDPEVQPIKDAYHALNEAVDGSHQAGVEEMFDLANQIEELGNRFSETEQEVLLNYSSNLRYRRELLMYGGGNTNDIKALLGLTGNQGPMLAQPYQPEQTDAVVIQPAAIEVEAPVVAQDEVRTIVQEEDQTQGGDRPVFEVNALRFSDAADGVNYLVHVGVISEKNTAQQDVYVNDIDGLVIAANDGDGMTVRVVGLVKEDFDDEASYTLFGGEETLVSADLFEREAVVGHLQDRVETVVQEVNIDEANVDEELAPQPQNVEKVSDDTQVGFDYDPDAVFNIDDFDPLAKPLPYHEMETIKRDRFHQELIEATERLVNHQLDPQTYSKPAPEEIGALLFHAQPMDFSTRYRGTHPIVSLSNRLRSTDNERLSSRAHDTLTEYAKSIQLGKGKMGKASETAEHSEALIEVLKHTLQDSEGDADQEKLRVLIPHAGSGHLISRIPAELRERMDITAISNTTLGGMVTSYLNPDITVLNGPLNEAGLLLGQKFDVVFGDIRSNRSTTIAHLDSQGHTQVPQAYLLAHSNEMLKPGGKLVAMISQELMDNPYPFSEEKKFQKHEIDREAFRGMISGTSQLLGAVRIPETDARNIRANKTGVTGDIVAFQKRSYNDMYDSKALKWESTKSQMKMSRPQSQNRDVLLGDIATGTNVLTRQGFQNEYYVSNPTAVLGTPYYTDFVADGYRVTDVEDTLYLETLRARIGDYFKSGLSETSLENAAIQLNIKSPKKFDLRNVEVNAWEHEGSAKIVLDNLGVEQAGRILKIEPGQESDKYNVSVVVDEATPRSVAVRQADFVRLGNAVRECIHAQSTEQGETEYVTQTRERLNQLYDSFIAQHGILHTRETHKARLIDPASGQVMAVELYRKDPVTKQVTADKAAIFRERVVDVERNIEDVDTAEEALLLSMGRYGDVRPEYISEILGRPWDDIYPEIESRVYIDPKLGKYVLSDFYLSGDVVSKVEEAEYAAKFAPGFERNVDALKASLPEPLDEDRMVFQLGADYVAEEVMTDFLKEHFEQTARSSEFKFSRNAKGDWEVEYNSTNADDLRRMKDKAAGDYIPPHRFLSDLVNQKLSDAPNKAKEKLTDEQLLNRTQHIRALQTGIRAEFQKWVRLSPKIHKELAESFNKTHNRYVEPKFDGSLLKLRGLSRERTPYDTQINAAYRGLITGAMIAAHEPGAGKTVYAALQAMALKQYRGEKTLVVAKLSTMGKFEKEMYKTFPNARIFVISHERAKPSSRRETIEIIKHGNFDFVLTSHNVLERMNLSVGAIENVFRDKLTNVRASFLTETRADKGGPRILTAERAIVRDKNKILSKHKDANGVICLDEIGIDNIILDENQYFKNFPYYTKHQNISGLHLSASQRATLLWTFCDHLRAKHGEERGNILMSGTPIMTSLIESYTLMRVNRPSVLTSSGIHSLDQFLKVFCEVRAETAPDGRGGVKTENKIKFHNGEPLMRLARMAMDFVTAEQANIERPKLRTHLNVIDKTVAQQVFDRELRARIDLMEAGGVPPEEDNVLVQRTHMALAALDTRLLYPSLVGDNKLMVVASNILKYQDEYKDRRGAQAVFLDIGVPGSTAGKVNLYQALKDTLVDAGFPQDKIVFAQEAKGDPALLEEIFGRIRLGEDLLIMGHIEQIGVGAEIQDRLCAVHIVNVDQSPGTLEQKIKRILRVKPDETKALFPDANVEMYMTKDSMDSLRLDRQNDRAQSLRKFLEGSAAFDTLDEDGESSLQQMKQCVWGDIPEFKELNDIETELKTLVAMADADADAVRRREFEREEHVDNIKDSETKIATLSEMSKLVDNYYERNKLSKISESDSMFSRQESRSVGEAVRSIARQAMVYRIVEHGEDGGLLYNGENIAEGHTDLSKYLYDSPEVAQKIFDAIEERFEDVNVDKSTEYTWFQNAKPGMQTFFDRNKEIAVEREKHQKLESEKPKKINPTKIERAIALEIYNHLNEVNPSRYTDEVDKKVRNLIEKNGELIAGLIQQHAPEAKGQEELIDDGSQITEPYRIEALIQENERLFIKDLKHGSINGIRGDVDTIQVAANRDYSRDKVAVFTWKDVPVYQTEEQFGRHSDNASYSILKQSGAESRLSEVSTLASVARAINPGLIDRSIKQAEDSLATSHQFMRALHENFVDNTDTQTRIAELQGEVEKLNNIIVERQAEIQAATADVPDTLAELDEAIKLGEIEPYAPTLDNIHERFTRYESVGDMRASMQETAEAEAKARLSDKRDNSIEGELVDESNAADFPQIMNG